jgi:hypothetical protein
MSDDNRFPLWKNPSKVIPDGVIPRDLDNQDLVELVIAYGVEPTHAEGTEDVIWVYFLPDEIQKFEDALGANNHMTLSLPMVAHGKSWWRNQMILWKSKKRWLAKQRAHSSQTILANGT